LFAGPRLGSLLIMLRSRPRVLVVDDENSVALLCRYVLEDAGYQVDTATTVQEACAWIRSEQYAAFLIDLVMPKEGGLEVIRTARAHAPRTPVVVMTAEPRHLVPIRVDVTHYLHKPFEGLCALEETVRKAIRLGPGPQPAAGPSASA